MTLSHFVIIIKPRINDVCKANTRFIDQSRGLWPWYTITGKSCRRCGLERQSSKNKVESWWREWIHLDPKAEKIRRSQSEESVSTLNNPYEAMRKQRLTPQQSASNNARYDLVLILESKFWNLTFFCLAGMLTVGTMKVPVTHNIPRMKRERGPMPRLTWFTIRSGDERYPPCPNPSTTNSLHRGCRGRLPMWSDGRWS